MRMLVLGLAAAGLACVPVPVRVTTQVDPETDFSRFHSYAQVPPPAQSAQTPHYTAALGERIQQEIARALDARGYRAAPVEDADLLVAFHVSRESRERIVSASDPDSQYYAEEPYVEGTLEIDVIDPRNGRRVWHGKGQAEIMTSGRLIPDDVDRAALDEVHAILAKFPAAN